MIAGVILAALAGGTALGWLHFYTLARVSDMLLAGRIAGVALQVARFAVLGLFLWFCATQGWPVLLAATTGVLLGRWILLRGAR